MSAVNNLIKRNLKLYLRDRSSIFFSLLSMLIVIMLMRPRGLWPAPEHGKMLAADSEDDGAPSGKQSVGASNVQPLTAQQNPPGVDSPADAIPGTTDVRQDALNP